MSYAETGRGVPLIARYTSHRSYEPYHVEEHEVGAVPDWPVRLVTRLEPVKKNEERLPYIDPFFIDAFEPQSADDLIEPRFAAVNRAQLHMAIYRPTAEDAGQLAATLDRLSVDLTFSRHDELAAPHATTWRAALLPLLRESELPTRGCAGYRRVAPDGTVDDHSPAVGLIVPLHDRYLSNITAQIIQCK